MSFQTDVQELKTGLIIFRRSDVEHKNWYCRVKVPNAATPNRYKTISLKTPNEREAKDKAFEHDGDIRFRSKHNVPIFEKLFGEVCDSYVARLLQKAEAGEITVNRYKIVESYFRLHIKPYCGHIQAPHISEDIFNGYPSWRKKHNAPEAAKKSYGRRKLKANGTKEMDTPKPAKPSTPAKVGTIRQEMASFLGAIRHGIKKKEMKAEQLPSTRLPEDNARREAFTFAEYRKLHTDARSKWLGEGETDCNNWYRQITYLYMLVMTNTGMRTIEARHLKWKNVEFRKDSQGRTIVVLSVKGKKKFRHLVAAENVARYFGRIREISPATAENDFVFCSFDGAYIDNYDAHVESLLTNAGLLYGENKTRRSAYSFRHTYATFRLMEGVDSLILANQMGTSQKMIEKHYGHITPVKNAERVLQGMTEWEPLALDYGVSPSRVDAKGAESKRKLRKK